MKKSKICFLFILCSFLFIGGKVYAEGEEVTAEQTTTTEKKINYTSYCKRYSDLYDRLTCCNSETDEGLREECKSPVYNTCVRLDTVTQRHLCCEGLVDKADIDECKSRSNQYCSSADSVQLSKEAANVKIVYEPYEHKQEGFDDETSPDYSLVYYMVDVKVYNLNSHMYLEVDNGDTTYNVGVDQMNDKGEIVLRNANPNTVKKYTFKIYSNTNSCKDKVLRTIKLTVPKYNLYSDRSACDDIPEYYLCHQFINFDIDGNNFLKNTENYKAKVGKTSVNNSDNAKSKSTINKTLTKISDNKIYIIGGILLIGVVITFVILRRRNG